GAPGVARALAARGALAGGSRADAPTHRNDCAFTARKAGRGGGPQRAHRSPPEPAPGRDGARDRKRTAEDRSAKLERAPLMKRWWLAYLAAALLVLLFHFRLALPGRALVANDFRALFIPLRTGLQHTVHAGEWPFWQ